MSGVATLKISKVLQVEKGEEVLGPGMVVNQG
jgi:hypothetical protein